jgi:hypothetical protein
MLDTCCGANLRPPEAWRQRRSNGLAGDGTGCYSCGSVSHLCSVAAPRRRILPAVFKNSTSKRPIDRWHECWRTRNRVVHFRRERNKPSRTLEVSTLKADSDRWDGSERKPRRKARPTWYSTPELN